jgi:hypothetical protein
MRRIPLSRRSHVTGYGCFESGAIEHESALERDFVILTSFADPDAVIVSQPMTIRFEDESCQRRYTPDFSVRWSDGRFELVEVKYRTDLRTNWSLLLPGFSVARDLARERGGRFRIATDRSIRCPRLENAKRLLPLRRAVLDPGFAEPALRATRSLTAPTFGKIIDAMDSDRAVALSAVWRLIAHGGLKVDLDAPIGFDTPVMLT